MLENIIFGFNMSLPMFLVMFVGWYLMKKEWLDQSFVSKANRMVFNVALPAKLMYDIAVTDIEKVMNPKLALFGIAGTVATFGAAWVFAEIFIKEPRRIGAFVHGSYRGNFVYIGLALIQNIMGKEQLVCAPLFMAVILPLYNVLAVIVLTIKSGDDKKIDPKEIILGIIKNPMIIGIFLGLPFAIFKIQIPFVFDKTLNYLGAIATPLALMLIGTSIRLGDIKKNIVTIAQACVIKLVVSPIIMMTIAGMMGFGQEEMVTLYVLFGVPSAANVYIMTETMGGDGELGSGIVVTTILLSILTLPIGIVILKTIGIV